MLATRTDSCRRSRSPQRPSDPILLRGTARKLGTNNCPECPQLTRDSLESRGSTLHGAVWPLAHLPGWDHPHFGFWARYSPQPHLVTIHALPRWLLGPGRGVARSTSCVYIGIVAGGRLAVRDVLGTASSWLSSGSSLLSCSSIHLDPRSYHRHLRPWQIQSCLRVSD